MCELVQTDRYRSHRRFVPETKPQLDVRDSRLALLYLFMCIALGVMGFHHRKTLSGWTPAVRATLHFHFLRRAAGEKNCERRISFRLVVYIRREVSAAAAVRDAWCISNNEKCGVKNNARAAPQTLTHFVDRKRELQNRCWICSRK